MCSLARNTRGLQQSGETHEKKYPSALLVIFFFYVPVSMLSLTKSGLTFPEQSIPTLRWILWQREQPLETELQSLARIHPSHLKEKCKWASVQKAEKKKKLCFWRLTRAEQLWQENYIKTQVVALRCCCSQCKPISSRLQTSGYELKCFSTSSALRSEQQKHFLLSVLSPIEKNESETQLSSGHATHWCWMGKNKKKKQLWEFIDGLSFYIQMSFILL